MSDVFGKKGREWVAALELPRDERHTVDGCLRHIDFVSQEIAILEREIAEHAIGSEEIKRPMTVPGVSLMTAATFMAAVGDIHRFPSPRRLVSYLGLDPKVRQSGSGQAKIGRISKQGAAPVRGMLVEAAFVAISTPGPIRAFYQRVSARRGKAIAIVAVARKLAVLFWHLLIAEKDYAFARPSLTAHKLRELELRAGAERRVGSPSLKYKSGYRDRSAGGCRVCPDPSACGLGSARVLSFSCPLGRAIARRHRSGPLSAGPDDRNAKQCSSDGRTTAPGCLTPQAVTAPAMLLCSTSGHGTNIMSRLAVRGRARGVKATPAHGGT